MDDQEQENSPQALETDGGEFGSQTSSLMERLREILERKELALEDLRQTVSVMKRNLAAQRDEIARLKNLNTDFHKPVRMDWFVSGHLHIQILVLF